MLIAIQKNYPDEVLFNSSDQFELQLLFLTIYSCLELFLAIFGHFWPILA